MVNASLRWLNNVSGVCLVQVFFLPIGQQGFGTFLQIGPCFLLAGGLCKLYVNAGGKQPMQRQLLLVQYKQLANQFYQYTIILHLTKISS
jgi:hypothetical protein